ncbi:hypothetical protein RLOC_00013531, partial [Lonchura striata]
MIKNGRRVTKNDQKNDQKIDQKIDQKKDQKMIKNGRRVTKNDQKIDKKLPKNDKKMDKKKTKSGKKLRKGVPGGAAVGRAALRRRARGGGRRAGAEPQPGDRRAAAGLRRARHLAPRHQPDELPAHGGVRRADGARGVQQQRAENQLQPAGAGEGPGRAPRGGGLVLQPDAGHGRGHAGPERLGQPGQQNPDHHHHTGEPVRDAGGRRGRRRALRGVLRGHAAGAGGAAQVPLPHQAGGGRALRRARAQRLLDRHGGRAHQPESRPGGGGVHHHGRAGEGDRLLQALHDAGNQHPVPRAHGPQAGVFLLPRPLLAGRVALHAPGLPGRQLRALPGRQAEPVRVVQPAPVRAG